MVRRKVEIEHKQRQLQNFEVQDDVPEDLFVISNEFLIHQNLIALLHQNVEELFVKRDRRQQRNGRALASVQVRVILLTINRELRHEL